MTRATSHPGLTQDAAANKGRPHIQGLLVLFRLAQASRVARACPPPIAKATAALYRGIALTVFSIDVPVSTQVGPGLRIFHGFGLVIHDRAVLGAGVTLRHGTTIGTRDDDQPAPRIGDGVDIGASALVLGAITVGDRSRIGAGSVVVHDVASDSAVFGNPARPRTKE